MARADAVLARVHGQPQVLVRLHRVPPLRPASCTREACAPSRSRGLPARGGTRSPLSLRSRRVFIAMSNWFPQSHRALRKISPVRHSLCTRTSDVLPSASDARSPPRRQSPYTNATCSMPSVSLLYDTAVNAPCSVGTRARRGSPHQHLALASVPHEVADQDHLQLVLFGKLSELRQARHRALRVVVRDLAQHPRGAAAGELREVVRRLGVPRPLQHAALAVAAAGRRARGARTRPRRAFASPSFAIVAARSPAEMPVVDAARSHDTVNAVRHRVLVLLVAHHEREVRAGPPSRRPPRRRPSRSCAGS